VHEREDGKGAREHGAAPAELAQQRHQKDAVAVPDAVGQRERDEGGGQRAGRERDGYRRDLRDGASHAPASPGKPDATGVESPHSWAPGPSRSWHSSRAFSASGRAARSPRRRPTRPPRRPSPRPSETSSSSSPISSAASPGTWGAPAAAA